MELNIQIDFLTPFYWVYAPSSSARLPLCRRFCVETNGKYTAHDPANTELRAILHFYLFFWWEMMYCNRRRADNLLVTAEPQSSN